MLGMEKRATVVVRCGSRQVIYTTVKFSRFTEYVETITKKIYDCFIAEINSDYCRTTYSACELSDFNNTLV